MHTRSRLTATAGETADCNQTSRTTPLLTPDALLRLNGKSAYALVTALDVFTIALRHSIFFTLALFWRHLPIKFSKIHLQPTITENSKRMHNLAT